MLINPKRLRKIKPDGLFKGKNRQLLDADGLVITDSIKAIKMNNGNTSTDSLEIAETLNEFFASVFIKDDSTVVDLNSECVTKCSDPIFNVCIV